MRIMNRFIFAGLLGMTLAGCAQTKTKMAADGRRPEPVGITPLPSLHESINRGMGSKQVKQSTLKDPSDPKWAGRASGPLSRDPAAQRTAVAARTFPIQKPNAPAQGDPIAAEEAKVASKNQGAKSAESTTTASTDAAEPKQEETSEAVAAGPAPADVPGPGSSASPVISANGLMPVGQPGANGEPETGKTDPAIGAASLPVPIAEPAPVAEPVADKDPTPEPVKAPVTPPSSEPATPASPGGDPLLGPNPNLMPAAPLEEAKPAADSKPKEVPPSPAEVPAAEPAPAAVPATPAETEKAPASAGETPAVTAPTSSPGTPAADPLLGPNPSLMPSTDAKAEADKAPEPAAPPLPVSEPEAEKLPALEAATPSAKESSVAKPATEPAPTKPAEQPTNKPTPEAVPAALPAASATPAPAEEAAEEMPIVGKAVDENGEEFGLPKLPDTVPADTPAKPKAAKVEPSPTNPPSAAPELSPAVTSPEAPADEAPAELPPLPADKVSAVAPRMPLTQPERDPSIRQAAASPAEIKTPQMSRDVKEAGRAAARVGEEVITLNEVVAAVKEFRKKHPSAQAPNKDELNMIAQGVLMMLIERSLLTQEAKRVLKNPKMLEQMMVYADKAWNEEELPPLYRKYLASNPYELREKMASDNRSLDAIYESFRQDFLAQAFLHQKIGGKLKADLPEMLKYYEAHKNDAENQRPAAIIWREIVVETRKYPSPQDARKKAETLRERLRKGEDFAKLARAESDGPSLSKSEGGRMETSPGSYNVPAVNQALETLPTGTISDILEGPTSLHIVVVEKRRPAGPVSFEEIQDQISKSIREEKVQKERIALITKLRKQTIVWTMFDNTASDPNRPVNYPTR